MNRVLILDANERSALAVTRSIGRQGIYVVTAEETTTSLAGSSRYCKNHFVYPSPRLHSKQFINFLINLVKEKHIDILMPMTELTTTLLLMHQNSFPGTVIPSPDESTVESLSNKCFLMKMAESLTVPIPLTWYSDDPDNLPCNLEDLPYPIVLKPGKSWLFHQGKWSRATVKFADNPSDAKNILHSYWAFKAHPFMIQEYVPGHGAGVFALYDNGKQLALFAHHRLREKPPNGGVSVLSESVQVDPILSAHARTLLENVNWHGVAMVEFKVATDGTPYLMEINTRFWGSLQLAVDAGVDFPHLLYRIASGEHPDPVTDYKIGIKLRWLLGDLDNLYLTMRDRQTSFITKIRALMHFFTPSPLLTRHEINRIDDLKPFWFELRQYVRDILR